MSGGPITNLDAPCMVCEKPAGDHTLREWSTCMGTITTDLPYADIPEDARRIADGLGLPDGTLVVDNFVAKSFVGRMDLPGGQQHVYLAGVLHEFSRSPNTGDPLARIAFIGDAGVLRQYGRLVRDTANGAARAAERAVA